jgi:hypothetical protein
MLTIRPAPRRIASSATPGEVAVSSRQMGVEIAD